MHLGIYESIDSSSFLAYVPNLAPFFSRFLEIFYVLIKYTPRAYWFSFTRIEVFTPFAEIGRTAASGKGIIATTSGTPARFRICDTAAFSSNDSNWATDTYMFTLAELFVLSMGRHRDCCVFFGSFAILYIVAWYFWQLRRVVCPYKERPRDPTGASDWGRLPGLIYLKRGRRRMRGVMFHVGIDFHLICRCLPLSNRRFPSQSPPTIFHNISPH